jgi:peptide methionine sulfoxide reductase msrA/msrB
MTKEIYFAGGCFWGTQHYLKQINGVLSTEAGYANGHVTNPTYEQVYTDTTGFAETVHVVYDPKIVSLELLLDLYFHTIDPTSLNKQGGDIGTRYRTGIYYTTEEDLPIIRKVYDTIAANHSIPLVVEVDHLINYYPAENYHQDYLDKNPSGYCHIPFYMMEMARKANRQKE